jgi:hypothetical protein
MCKYCVKKVYFFGFKGWKMLIKGKYLIAIEGGEEPRLYESTSDSTHSSSS